MIERSDPYNISFRTCYNTYVTPLYKLKYLCFAYPFWFIWMGRLDVSSRPLLMFLFWYNPGDFHTTYQGFRDGANRFIWVVLGMNSSYSFCWMNRFVFNVRKPRHIFALKLSSFAINLNATLNKHWAYNDK